MARTNKLSRIFRSIKNNNKQKPRNEILTVDSTPITKSSPSTSSSSSSSFQRWCVYLILSTNIPIKTYVGSTNNFDRRLKQHNGELSGGAKASRAGRPWVCACIIRGFQDQSEACVFESKWKNISRKLPRKMKNAEKDDQPEDGSHLLLQHRRIALERVKCLIDCTHLDFDWQLSPS